MVAWAYIYKLLIIKNMNNNISVRLEERTSKKTGKKYNCLVVSIGELEKLCFFNSQFELNYVKNILLKNEKI